jgi:hypothetical protein
MGEVVRYGGSILIMKEPPCPSSLPVKIHPCVRLAINHSGDSDSTGSITGNILGALLGELAIPVEWLDQLELKDVIRQVGDDLFTAFEGTESWLKRYPPL